MIEAVLFTLAGIVFAFWEGMPLWRDGLRREAVAAWGFWGLGLIAGNALILTDGQVILTSFLDRVFGPLGRFLQGY